MKEEDLKEKANKIVDKIKELVKKGNVSKIIIKKDGEIIVNLPLNVGLVGAIIAPWAMLVATIVTLGTDCDIIIQTTDNNTIKVNTEEENSDK